MQKLKNLKKGEYFTKKEIEFPNEKQVWVKDDYDRATKKYICYCWGDVNKSCLIDGEKIVFVNFTF